MKLLFKLLPWFFVALFGAEVVAVFFAPKKDSEFHLREFGRLPVVMGGRVQPLDSVAHNTLLQIRSTADVPLEEVPSWKFWHHPKKLRSTEWLAEVLFKPDVADTRPIFLIHHPELLSELNLQEKGVEKSGLRYYTFNELKPVGSEILKQAANAPSEEKQRTALQKQVVKLANALYIYQMMKAAARPPGWDDFQKELAAFEKTISPGLAALHAQETGQDYDKQAFEAFMGPLKELYGLSQDKNAGQKYPLIIPPYRADQKHDDWTSISLALVDSARTREIAVPVKEYAAIATAYVKDDASSFNAAIADYRSWLAKGFAKELKKGRFEFYYNDIKAFLHAIIMYIAAFVLAGGALISLSAAPSLSDSLRRSALYLIILAGIVHTFGLVFRMYLEGRPPVTNLYSSAVFIGWGAMVLGIVIERIYRVGLGNIVASFAGFVTLLIAHNLALGGEDTMEMMRAVLDTNFWLATHVVTVTLGYASTFVAGLLAITFIVLGLFTPLLTRKLTRTGAAALSVVGGPKTAVKLAPEVGKTDFGRAIGKMVYGIVCFATLFSFIGTVLGGIWADQSWGRFWGWDVKENGALIIVLWNALILHARWGGLIKDRGLANMAVFGNVVTAFSWFGVNMLGIGLHSYGFMDAAFKWLVIFIGSQVAIIALGLIPLRYWSSFRSRPIPDATPLPPDSAAAPA